jgi:hypothetical protein
MALRSDPRRFSITAFMADQVTLVARHDRVSPGEAALRLQTMSGNPAGRRQLLAIVRDACRTETNPVERSKLTALRAQVVAWNQDAEVAR